MIFVFTLQDEANIFFNFLFFFFLFFTSPASGVSRDFFASDQSSNNFCKKPRDNVAVDIRIWRRSFVSSELQFRRDFDIPRKRKKSFLARQFSTYFELFSKTKIS